MSKYHLNLTKVFFCKKKKLKSVGSEYIICRYDIRLKIAEFAKDNDSKIKVKLWF